MITVTITLTQSEFREIFADWMSRYTGQPILADELAIEGALDDEDELLEEITISFDGWCAPTPDAATANT